ncbi:MAG: hypothetical protein IKE43_08450 [Coriobacteriales bacterium]|nr:hypothetical protein [Coriobacteriales bacterium]
MEEKESLRSKLVSLGYELNDRDFEAFYREYLDVAEKKDEVYDADLESIVEEYRRNINAIYTIDAVQISCGFPLTPTATVTLTNNETGQIDTACAYGTGPIDAVCQAIDQIVQIESDLTEFSVNAITRGIDALGEVTMRVTGPDGKILTGRGSDGDIVVASARAYINALNKLITHERVNS